MSNRKRLYHIFLDRSVSDAIIKTPKERMIFERKLLHLSNKGKEMCPKLFMIILLLICYPYVHIKHAILSLNVNIGDM